MPPKLRAGFLLGPVSDNLGDTTTRCRSIFDVGTEDDSSGTSRVSGTNFQEPTTAGRPARPRSVNLKPEEPSVERGSGPALQIRQLWEGTVTEVSEEGFLATLRDKTNKANPDEEAEFEFESIEVQEDDKPLVRPGSVFYLMMGKEKARSGQISTVSRVEFRRLPRWTRSSLVDASQRANSLRQWFALEK